MDRTPTTNDRDDRLRREAEEVAMNQLSTETARKLQSLTMSERAVICTIVNDLGYSPDEGGGPVITIGNLQYVPWPHLIECVDLAIDYIETQGLDGHGDEDEQDTIKSAICKVSRQRTDTPAAYWSHRKGRYVLLTEIDNEEPSGPMS